MIQRAKGGDAAAAKLVLDKLTDCDPLRVQVSRGDEGAMSDTDVVARVRMLFASADAREAQMRALLGEADEGDGGGQ
jgi:hypothetical protein